MEQLDEEKTKVILNLFCKFLQKQGCTSALFEADEEGSLLDDTFFCGGEGNMKPPFPMEKILESLIDPHLVGEIETEEGEGEVYSYEVYIYPDKRLELIANATGYNTEDAGSTDEEDIDPSVFEGLPEEEFTVEFTGGGDSGYIEDYGSMKGNEQVTITENLNDVMYKMLENYGGWEINEGSQGTFFVNPTERSIRLEFSWNTEVTLTETIWEWNFAD